MMSSLLRGGGARGASHSMAGASSLRQQSLRQPCGRSDEYVDDGGDEEGNAQEAHDGDAVAHAETETETETGCERRGGFLRRGWWSDKMLTRPEVTLVVD